MTSGEYKCTLSDDVLEVAREELSEDPEQRMGRVKALRDWIGSQPHIRCRTDTAFLLKYLRTAKFCQLRARSMLEGYHGLKVEFPDWYLHWDPREELVSRLFKTGAIVVLPGYIRHGVKVLVYRFEKVGDAWPEKLTKLHLSALVRYWFMIFHHVMQDENVQVCGVLYILDFTNLPLRVLALTAIEENKKIMRFQGNMAGRFKGYWYINEGSLADMVSALFRPFMKKKIQERFRLLGHNLENLYKDIPQTMLPVEYLPDDYKGANAGSFDSLTRELWKEITSEVSTNELLLESDPKWKINVSEMPDQPAASFRKLNID